MRKVIFIFLVVIIFIGSGLYFTGLVYAPKVPAIEAGNMEKSIAFARRQGAEKFASKEFQKCTGLHKEAMKEWKVQNKLWIIKRNYSRLKNLISQTTQAADLAGKKAVETSGSMTKFIEETQNSLIERDQYFSDNFRVLPLKSAVLKEYAEAHLLLHEAVSAHKRNDLNSAYSKLGIAFEAFEELEKKVRKELDIYFQSYPDWNKWYKQTVQKSRDNKSYAIVVDKMAHQCIILKDGKIIDKLEADLSVYWLGHKKEQGDKATPEGIYKITKKVNQKNTKYYKALLLDYPNDNDKAIFEKNKRSGNLSPHAKIGGLIEIHGEGGKGKDWTEGCVALSNNDIDKLYSMINTGTTVAIVGSLVPLNELFN